jgi:hypothetical protein
MNKPKTTWRKKQLAQEEDGTDNSEGQGKFEIGESSGMTKENETPAQSILDVNMVFIIPEEFRSPKTEVVEVCMGIERAVFERPPKIGEHMKPL